jgi:hypothetical protein
VAVVHLIFLFGGCREYLFADFRASGFSVGQAWKNWIDGYVVFDWDRIIEEHDQTSWSASAFAGSDFVGDCGGKYVDGDKSWVDWVVISWSEEPQV